MGGILTITVNPALDVTTSVARLQPHVKMRCEAPVYEPGGGGVNVSRMIARLGGKSTAFVALGGAVGEEYRRFLSTENFSLRVFKAPSATRESLQVVDRSDNAQYRFILPGPEWASDDEDALFTAIQKEVASGDYGWVVASGSLAPGLSSDFYGRIASCAKTHGARFILDSSGVGLREAFSDAIYLVKPDWHEMSALAGGEDVNDEELERAALNLVTTYGLTAVIYTRGEKGAVLVTNDYMGRWYPPKVEVKSLTGAGDAFLAAVVFSLSRGEDLAKATAWGVAAAAATAESKGTALADPKRVKALYKKVIAT